MNIELYINRKKQYVSFNYEHIKDDEHSEYIKSSIKQIPGRKYDYGNTWLWFAPLNETTYKYIDVLCDYFHFEKPDDFIAIVKKYKAKFKRNLKLSSADTSEFTIKNLKLELYPYQKAGVDYILKNKKVIIGDEMGLGKTPQAIATFVHLNSKRVVIITPNTLKLTWYYEILKWTNITEDDISVIVSSKQEDFSKRIILINYDIVKKYEKELKKQKFNLMILDESHYVKNGKSMRSKAVFSLSRKIPYRLLLTGTAIGIAPIELLNQLKIIDSVNVFGDTWNFKTRYCDATEITIGWDKEFDEPKTSWDFKGSSNLEELHTKLRENCYVRRNKKDVLKDLPEKIQSIVYLDITNRKTYNKAVNSLVDYLKEKNGEEIIKDVDDSMFGKIQQQVESNNPSQKIVNEALLKINILRQLSIKGKLKSIKEWVTDFLETGEKLVLFAYHVEIVEAISDHFKCNKIYGNTDVEDRQKYVEDFQTNPNTKLIVLNIKSGSVGLTLTSASNMAIVELSWRPDDLDQMEARIDRIGQLNISNIFYLLGHNTIDIKMYNILEDRRKVALQVNAGVEYEQKYIGDEHIQSKSIIRDVLNSFIISEK